MRISDWSSDVCSSDLSVGEAAEGLARLRHLARRERRDRIGEAGQRRGDAADPLRVAGVAHAQGKSCSRSDRICAVGIEIGRASCRERVCQYVEISVVAGALTKTKYSL